MTYKVGVVYVYRWPEKDSLDYEDNHLKVTSVIDDMIHYTILKVVPYNGKVRKSGNTGALSKEAFDKRVVHSYTESKKDLIEDVLLSGSPLASIKDCLRNTTA